MVSVIIPYYNSEKWIAKTIDSCLVQRDYLHEIIIVNDASPDKGVEIIKEYSNRFPEKIKLFENPLKGGNNARNFGFSKATGEYIQWLDADDLLLENKFETQIEALKNQNGDVCYSDWQKDFYENDIKVKSEKVIYGPYSDFCYELLKDNWTSPNNYLLTYHAAKLIVENRGWNPETKVCQDREYFTIGALLGLKFVYAHGNFAVYNLWSSSSVSKMSFDKRLEHNQWLEKRFFDLIQNIQDKRKRKRFSNIIYTHHLKAIFYNPKIKLHFKFSLLDVVWSQVHWKMRLVLPLVFLKAKVKQINS